MRHVRVCVYVCGMCRCWWYCSQLASVVLKPEALPFPCFSLFSACCAGTPVCLSLYGETCTIVVVRGDLCCRLAVRGDLPARAMSTPSPAQKVKIQWGLSCSTARGKGQAAGLGKGRGGGAGGGGSRRRQEQSKSPLLSPQAGGHGVLEKLELHRPDLGVGQDRGSGAVQSQRFQLGRFDDLEPQRRCVGRHDLQGHGLAAGH